jgi:predicted hotdog family 3-hydroxylacyl-ACP dehydratase
MNMTNDIQIESLIPHRDRMKLIETIVYVDQDKAISNTTVSERWPLYKDGAVSPIVLIELVAQTAGICIGWKEKIKNNSKDGGKGWIVGVKQAVFHVDELTESSKITTCSEVVFSHHNFAAFSGTCTIDTVTVGEISIQVFRPDK